LSRIAFSTASSASAGRPAKLSAPAKRNVAVGVVRVARNRTLRLGNRLGVLLRVHVHRARHLVRKRRRVLHCLRQVLLGDGLRVARQAERRTPISRVDLPMDRCQCGPGATVGGIDLGGFLEVGDGRLELVRRLLQIVLPALEHHVVGLDVVRTSPRNAIALVLRQFDGQCLGDVARDRVLQREDILELAVVAVRPDVRAGRCVEELRVDADALALAAYAAFENIAGVQRLADVANVACLALVLECGIARDHEQAADLGEVGDQVFGHPVGEIGLVRVAAHVVERQHGNRRLSGGHRGGNLCRTSGRCCGAQRTRVLPGADRRGDQHDADCRYPREAANPSLPQRDRGRRVAVADRKGPNRIGNVLHDLLAELVEGCRHAILHGPSHRLRYDDAARHRDRLQPSRDVDAVAVRVAAFGLDHVAEVHANPEAHPAIFRNGARRLVEGPLDRQCGGNRAGCGVEHREHRIAGHVDHAAAVGLDLVLERRPRGIERGQRRALIRFHQARIACRVGSEDRRQMLALAAFAHARGSSRVIESPRQRARGPRVESRCPGRPPF
jgi:hypothetical protein